MPAFLLKRESGSSGGTLEYPTGTIQAIVVGLYDLGTHANPYNKTNPEEDRKRRISIRYELCGHHYTDKDGGQHPLTMMNSEDFKLWSNPDGTKCTNLWSQVSAIVGPGNLPKEDEDFDFSTLLGQNVWITIIETASGNFKITNHTQIPEGMQRYAAATPLETFMVTPDESGGITIPDNLPQWVKDDIESSDEYQEWINSSVQKTAAGPLPVPTVAAAPQAAPAVAPAPAVPAPAPAVAPAPAPAAPATAAPPPVAPAAVPAPAAPAPAVAPAPTAPPAPDLSKVPEALRPTVEAATQKLTETQA